MYGHNSVTEKTSSSATAEKKRCSD